MASDLGRRPRARFLGIPPRRPTFEGLDRRGFLGDAPSPALLASATFLATVAIGASLYMLGRTETASPGLLYAVVATVGLSLAVGAGLAVMQYRWAEQVEEAYGEIALLRASIDREREHVRMMVHDAKAGVAALGAATHALSMRDPDDPIASALERQLAHLRTTLERRSTTREGFHLSDVLAGLAAFADLHDIRLIVREDDVELVGDSSATLQILQNLVDNSRKYSGTGAVRVWSEPAGEHHRLVIVEDDGPGMDASAVDRLFKPGVRSGSSTQGFGMGLTIARHLAEDQGGALWYDDSWHGARFVLKLSVAP